MVSLFRSAVIICVSVFGVLTLNGCKQSELANLGLTVDLSKPGDMGMGAVNGRMHAFTSDSIEFSEKFRHLSHGEEGSISENGVFIVEGLSSSPEESAKIANNFGLTEVTDRKDPDSLDCSRLSEPIAARWRAGAPNIRFYKSMNKPEALQLKSGRHFDHAFYFYDSDAKNGKLELSYGTAADVRAAEAAFDKYMTPKAPPADLLARATKGDAQSQFELGKFFQKNNPMNRGIPYSSVDWYKKAATQNHAQAQFELGSIYLERFVPHDQEEGMKWLKLAAQAGNASAMGRLGERQLHSSNDADRLAGQELLKKSASAGNVRSLLSLAYASKDTNAAINLLLQATAINSPESKEAIPLLVQKLQSVGRSEEALHYMRIGADGGNTGLQIELSNVMDSKGDYQESVKYARMACNAMPSCTQMFGPPIGSKEMEQAQRLEKDNDLKQAASLYRQAFALNSKAWSNSF